MLHILKSKTRVLGDGLNCGELLEALSSPLFEEQSPVQIRCDQNMGWLKMIYRCQNCSRLHFTMGDFDPSAHLEAVVHHRIYADHYSDGETTTKEELVSILQEMAPETEIVLETSVHGAAYKLTIIYQCNPDCPCVHLDCYYERDAIIPN